MRSVAAVLAAANWPESREPVLVVGHQPTLGMVASFLLSGEEAYWSVRKGAVWWLSNRAKEDGASVVLKAVQSPDFLLARSAFHFAAELRGPLVALHFEQALGERMRLQPALRRSRSGSAVRPRA